MDCNKGGRLQRYNNFEAGYHYDSITTAARGDQALRGCFNFFEGVPIHMIIRFLLLTGLFLPMPAFAQSNEACDAACGVPCYFGSCAPALQKYRDALAKCSVTDLDLIAGLYRGTDAADKAASAADILRRRGYETNRIGVTQNTPGAQGTLDCTVLVQDVDDASLAAKSVSALVARCDAEAAHPSYAPKGVTGKWGDFVDIDRALDACRAAHKAAPSMARIAAWLSRIEWYAGNHERSFELAQTADAQDHAYGSMLLGHSFQHGNGTLQDFGKAMRVFSRAAERGYYGANTKLAWFHRNGLGVTQNDSKAFSLVRTAHEEGNVIGTADLAWHYAKGRGVTRDYDEALRLYQQALEQGATYLYRSIGNLYRDRTDEQRDYVKALEWYRQGLAAGDKLSESAIANARESGQGMTQDRGLACRIDLAQLSTARAWPYARAAWCHQHGHAGAKDIAKAIELYRKASYFNNTWAMRSLGDLYRAGDGVPKDVQQAIFWYQKAANNGDADGFAKIADLYDDGDGVPQDHEKAVAYLRKAAARKSAWGMNFLGWMYEKGKGVVKSLDKADEWYEKSADAGNAMAISNLGKIAENKGDTSQAIRWYEKGVEQKNLRSIVFLARIYGYGRGVPENTVKAERLFLRALEISPSSEWVLDSITDFYLTENNPRKAVPILERLVALETSESGENAMKLASLYIDSPLGPDLENVLKWARKAQDLGYERADEAINAIRKRMSEPSLGQLFKGQSTPSGAYAGDVPIGSAQAQIELVIYSSMSCAPCARLYTQVLPQIQAEFSEQVRVIFRDFPLHGAATEAAMVARCGGRNRYLDFVSLLMSQQAFWIKDRQEHSIDAIKNLISANGIAVSQIEQCLSDDDLRRSIQRIRESASEDGVSSTPTVFINGTKFSQNFDQLRGELARMLGRK